MAAEASEKESALEGLGLMQKCTKEQAEKVMHGALESLCGGNPPRFQHYSRIWNMQEWKVVTKALNDAVKLFIGKGMDKQQISAKLDHLSLSAEVRQAMLDCLWARRDEITHQLVTRTAEITNSYLKDFDWKLKLIMASDKLAAIREPVVSVDFDIQQGSREKHVTVELTRDELKDFITSLEAANKVVLQLKG